MNRSERKQEQKKEFNRKIRTGVIVAGTAFAALFIVFNGAAGLGNSTAGVASALEPEVYAEMQAVENYTIPEETVTVPEEKAETTVTVQTRTMEPVVEAPVAVEEPEAEENVVEAEETTVVEEAPTAVEETVVNVPEENVQAETPVAEQPAQQEEATEEPAAEEADEVIEIEVTETNETKYAGSDLNVRELPTTDSEVVGSLAKGEEVTVVGVTSDGWSKIMYNSTAAYVSSIHLVVEKAEASDEAAAGWKQEETAMPETKLGLEGKISADAVTLANQYYEALPAKQRASFERDGWKMIITDKNIAQAYAPELAHLGSLAGITTPEQKVIYLSSKASSICSALVHEFGHYVDYKNGMASRGTEFSDIFSSEAAKFSDGSYAQSSQEEFFAEVYKQAILSPEVCKTTVPNAYQFVMNCAAAL